MKKLLALLLALTMVFALCACGQTATPAESKAPAQSGESAEPSAEEVTLDIIISQYGNKTKEWWDKFDADFEAANPSVKLNIEIVSWNDIYQVVNTRISTNSQPDILNISGFADYVADDLLMPAEEYVSAETKANLVPSFWESNAIDGTVWALPILASCRALFCNMDVLNEAGIENPPTTWEEVMTACAAIKEKCPDVVPWGLDISTDEGQAAFSYYTFNNGGGFVDANGDWAINSAENVEAVEFIAELYNSGYCNANPATDTRYPLQDSFNAGSLAMMIGPFNMITADSAVNYAVADLPSQTGTPVALGVCDQLMVFKDEDAKDQAARTAAITKFFDAFYEKETYAGYMVYEGFLPATLDASEHLATNADKYTDCNGAPGRNEFFANFCALLPSCQFYPMQKAEWMDVRNGVIEVEQQVCEGLISAQDALDALQAKVS